MPENRWDLAKYSTHIYSDAMISEDPAKGYRLESKVGMNARWHGRLLIRSKVCFASS
ncbi:unnamed protein product [Cladocopium goreaui]|uniref:MORN repeat-containing protein n=1 Tax=Cladocopium goreaui TaxID=2562237 RepID=A0A9P1GL96_9DINO|nr:unnamed protein product [Cladocopium goreaui]